MSDIEQIMRYENGEMSYEEIIELFQDLVTTGQAWSLQGHYGRTAGRLIEMGDIQPPSKEDPNVHQDK